MIRKNSNNMENKSKYDVVIIGGSYSGLAAGMALGRALKNVLIIDSGDPCNKQTPYSHNFLTNDGKTPEELRSIARHQVKMYETVEMIDALATAVKKIESGLEVEINSQQIYFAKKIIFATGIKDMFPSIPGFSESWGISVLHCPYCHGYEVRDQKTGILANGDAGFELSTLIFNWTVDLRLYTNGKSLITEEQTKKLAGHHINIVESEIEKIQHLDGQIQNLVFKNGTAEQLQVLYARLPFEQHCPLPQILGCELTDDGYIKTDATHKTTVKGVYACGDNTTRIRTVANAVAMGTTTGIMVNKELIEEQF